MKHRFLILICVLSLLLAAFPFTSGAEGEELLLPPGTEADAAETSAAPQEGEEAPAEGEAAQQDPTPSGEPEPSQDPTPAEGTEQPQEPVPTAPPEPVEEIEEGRTMVYVGLAYGSNTVAGANLKNSVGEGYRFGFMDEERRFHTLGRTAETGISVVKTQNVYYGYAYGKDLVSYSDQTVSDILVGCWHVQLPWECATFSEAKQLADDVGGFPAWINGTYQVRLGAYGTKEEAQAAAEAAGGTLAGTSAYGVSVVKTKTNTILFQFDGGAEKCLTVMPGEKSGQRTATWFKGVKYYGGFKYQRISGGDMTVVNVVDIDDYVSCVISQEMSPSWPLEALKAQAVCARTYQQFHLRSHSQHKASEGFEVCPTTHCQAYPGLEGADSRTDKAVAETAGQCVWYNDAPADTVYFASDGGATEDAKNVWGTAYPYLVGVIDPYEETIKEKIPYWDYQKSFTLPELNAIVQPYIQSKGYAACGAIVDFQVTELSETGNVMSIAFTDENGKVWPFTKTNANKFRGLLKLQSIRYTVTKSGGAQEGTYAAADGGEVSTANGLYAIGGKGKPVKLSGDPYVITASGIRPLPAPAGQAPSPEETVFTITSRGYGHNVGMSQWGAYAMAKQGLSYRDILTFYYTGIEIR